MKKIIFVLEMVKSAGNKLRNFNEVIEINEKLLEINWYVFCVGKFVLLENFVPLSILVGHKSNPFIAIFTIFMRVMAYRSIV